MIRFLCIETNQFLNQKALQRRQKRQKVKFLGKFLVNYKKILIFDNFGVYFHCNKKIFMAMFVVISFKARMIFQQF